MLKLVLIEIIGRTLFIAAFFSNNQKVDYPKHQGDRNRFMKAIDTHLRGSDLSRRGPFLIGNEITYADMTLYQVLHDENSFRMVERSCKHTQGSFNWLTRLRLDQTSRSSLQVMRTWIRTVYNKHAMYRKRIAMHFQSYCRTCGSGGSGQKVLTCTN